MMPSLCWTTRFRECIFKRYNIDASLWSKREAGMGEMCLTHLCLTHPLSQPYTVSVRHLLSNLYLFIHAENILSYSSQLFRNDLNTGGKYYFYGILGENIVLFYLRPNRGWFSDVENILWSSTLMFYITIFSIMFIYYYDYVYLLLLLLFPLIILIG